MVTVVAGTAVYFPYTYDSIVTAGDAGKCVPPGFC